ncbi:imidazole glycerol phosphate synthase subunit HisH [bacterium]|nr:imidazole glycerol phosphate synthase subunit HisH [bacterium]
MTTIIQYGAGNIFSVAQALKLIGEEAILADTPEQLETAERLILPGVGAFGAAMKSLRRAGLDEAIIKVVKKGTPLMGICLGYQLLFESSDESPGIQGLGLFKGCVRRFNAALRIPQLGWNHVRYRESSSLFTGIRQDSYFYFANSYYTAPTEDIGIGHTEYGRNFISAAQRGKLFGVQFHPEKSQGCGKQLLTNFIQLEEQ